MSCDQTSEVQQSSRRYSSRIRDDIDGEMYVIRHAEDDRVVLTQLLDHLSEGILIVSFRTRYPRNACADAIVSRGCRAYTRETRVAPGGAAYRDCRVSQQRQFFTYLRSRRPRRTTCRPRTHAIA
jgi:hypothetical protein